MREVIDGATADTPPEDASTTDAALLEAPLDVESIALSPALPEGVGRDAEDVDRAALGESPLIRADDEATLQVPEIAHGDAEETRAAHAFRWHEQPPAATAQVGSMVMSATNDLAPEAAYTVPRPEVDEMLAEQTTELEVDRLRDGSREQAEDLSEHRGITELTDNLSYDGSLRPFGRVAVELADEAARAAIDETPAIELDANELLAEQLAALRGDFRTWNEALNHPDTDAYSEAVGIISHFDELDAGIMPKMLVHSYNNALYGPEDIDIGPDDDIETIGNVFTWIDSLPDTQLVNLLQWSNARAEAASAALAAKRADIQENNLDYLDEIIGSGLAPESARIAMQRGFDQTVSIGAIDSFTSGFYQAAGLYDGATMELGIRRMFDPERVADFVFEGRRVLLHEDLHALDFANDMGLTYLVNEDEEPQIWVNEALKEHLTLAGTQGQPFIVRPSERLGSGTYADLRELLYLVMTSGEIEFSIDELTFANFEPIGTENGNRQILDVRLRDSYKNRLQDIAPGETILQVIAKEHNAAPKPHKDAVIKSWIQKLNEWKNQESITEDEEILSAGRRQHAAVSPRTR